MTEIIMSVIAMTTEKDDVMKKNEKKNIFCANKGNVVFRHLT